jgi:hypothetical protein
LCIYIHANIAKGINLYFALLLYGGCADCNILERIAAMMLVAADMDNVAAMTHSHRCIHDCDGYEE